MCEDYTLSEKLKKHSKEDWLDKITPYKENKMEKTCGWCSNFYNKGWCKLNPTTVAKDADDTCSHWAPKMVNEFKGCCGMVNPINEDI